jgi:hypothetical protein
VQTDKANTNTSRIKPPLRPEDRHDPFDSRSKPSSNDDGWDNSFRH